MWRTRTRRGSVSFSPRISRNSRNFSSGLSETSTGPRGDESAKAIILEVSLSWIGSKTGPSYQSRIILGHSSDPGLVLPLGRTELRGEGGSSVGEGRKAKEPS